MREETETAMNANEKQITHTHKHIFSQCTDADKHANVQELSNTHNHTFLPKLTYTHMHTVALFLTVLPGEQ